MGVGLDRREAAKALEALKAVPEGRERQEIRRPVLKARGPVPPPQEVGLGCHGLDGAAAEVAPLAPPLEQCCGLPSPHQERPEAFA